MQDANTVVDREFLIARCQLLEVAATFDRVDRADGGLDDDHAGQMAQLRAALDVLSRDDDGRAEALLNLFSDE